MDLDGIIGEMDVGIVVISCFELMATGPNVALFAPIASYGISLSL